MRPRWPGYRGEITATAKNKYDVVSVVNKINATTVEITELPIHKRTTTCKVELESMIAGKENDAGTTKEYKEHHENVHFVITMDAKQLKKAEEKGLTEFFKFTSKIQTSNLICLDFGGKIKKSNSPEEKRKDHLAGALQDAFEKLTNQARFVKMIVDKELIINSRKKAEIIVDLKRHQFRPFPKISKAKEAGEQEDALEQEEEDAALSYVQRLPLTLLGQIDKLLQTAADKEQELLALLKISPKEMWHTDLDKFMAEWEASFEEELEIKKHLDANGKKIKRKQTTLKTRKSIGRFPAHKGRPETQSKRPEPAAKNDDDDDDDNDEPPPPEEMGPAQLSNDDDDDMDVDDAPPPKKKAPAKAISIDSDDDDEPPKGKGKAKAAPKRKSLDSAIDSDDEPPKKKKSLPAQPMTDFFSKAGPSGAASKPAPRKISKSMKPASPPKPKKAPPKKLVNRSPFRSMDLPFDTQQIWRFNFPHTDSPAI
ncbi:DNA topoisomerase [Mycena polygramma]|nr:DNA topoisomerase [Mycena polygramma]